VVSVVASVGLVPVPSQAAKPPKPPKPAIIKVTPASGSVAGGLTVTVKGKNLTGAKKVLFGSTKGTQLKVKSAKKLTVVAPAHAAGAVDVFVVTKGGKSKKVKGDVFTYVAAPPTPPVTPPATPASRPVTAPLPTNAGPGASAVADVACPAAGSCQAVGFYGTLTQGRRPLLETLSGGTWSPTELPLPLDASTTNANANLAEIACPTTTFCAAVGEYNDTAAHQRPLLETWNGSAWTAASAALPAPAGASAVPFMDAVACSSAGTCVAVGRYSESSVSHPLVATLAGGTWTFQAVPLPAGATAGQLLDVTCPASQCIAVGAVTPTAGAPARPLIETGAGASWVHTEPTLPADSAAIASGLLAAVSCATATVCTAVGSYKDNDVPTNHQQPLIETLGAGTWTPSTVAPPAGAATEPFANLWDVSCPTVVYCAASGSYLTAVAFDSSHAMVVTISSGTPTASDVSLPSGHPTAPQASLTHIVCTAVGSCAGAGGYQQSGGQSVGLLARVSGSVQPGASPPSPAGATSLFFNGVASDTTTTGVAVGGYSSPSGNRGVLMTGVPIGPPFA
jgi:hypothetical protein